MSTSTDPIEKEKNTSTPNTAVEKEIEAETMDKNLTDEAKDVDALKVDVETTHKTKEVKREVVASVQERILTHKPFSFAERRKALRELIEQFELSKKAIDQGCLEKAFDWMVKDDDNKTKQKEIIKKTKNRIADLNKRENDYEHADDVGYTPNMEILRTHYLEAYGALQEINEAIDANLGDVNIQLYATPEDRISKRVKERPYAPNAPVVVPLTGATLVNQNGEFKQYIDLSNPAGNNAILMGNNNRYGNVDRSKAYENDKSGVAGVVQGVGNIALAEGKNFTEAFERGGILGTIRKAMDSFPNMTPQQKNTRASLGFLALSGFGIYKAGSWLLSKETGGFRKKLGIVGGTMFAANALTGKDIFTLLGQVATGGLDFEQLKRNMSNFITFGRDSSPETVAWINESYLPAACIGTQRIGDFQKMILTDGGYDSRRRINYANMQKNGIPMPTIEAFGRAFPETATQQEIEQYMREFFKKFGLDRDKLTDEEKQLTGEEITNRLGENNNKLKNWLQANKKRIKKEKNTSEILNKYLIKEEVSDETFEQMERKGMFEADEEAIIKAQENVEKRDLASQLEELEYFQDLSESKQKEVKDGLKAFYDAMPEDNKPRLSFYERDGKLFMLSHTRQNGESVQVEIDLKEKTLPNFVQNEVVIPFRKGGYKGLFSAAYLSNGIINIAKDKRAEAKSDKPFSYRNAKTILKGKVGFGIYFDDTDIAEWGLDTQMLSDGPLNLRGKMGDASPELHDHGQEYADYLNWLWQYGTSVQIKQSSDNEEEETPQENQVTAEVPASQNDSADRSTTTATTTATATPRVTATATATGAGVAVATAGDTAPETPDQTSTDQDIEPQQNETEKRKKLRDKIEKTVKEMFPEYTVTMYANGQCKVLKKGQTRGQLDIWNYVAEGKFNETSFKNAMEEKLKENTKKSRKEGEKLPESLENLIKDEVHEVMMKLGGQFENLSYSFENPYIMVSLRENNKKNTRAVKKQFDMNRYDWGTKNPKEASKMFEIEATKILKKLDNYRELAHIFEYEKYSLKEIYESKDKNSKRFKRYGGKLPSDGAHEAYFKKFGDKKRAQFENSSVERDGKQYVLKFSFKVENRKSREKDRKIPLEHITNEQGKLDKSKLYGKLFEMIEGNMKKEGLI